MSQLIQKASRPYSQSFMDRCVDLFMGFDAGHMGPEMYVDHSGVRLAEQADGSIIETSMSGVSTWEAHAQNGSIPKLSDSLIAACSTKLKNVIGHGLPIIEFGPGSMKNGKHLITGLGSTTYIPVDYSEGILQHAAELRTQVPACSILPRVGDFFDGRIALEVSQPALGALLGLTITNLSGPVPNSVPSQQLVFTLRKLSRALSPAGGFLLISTHNEPDGICNEERYSEPDHKAFGVNFLYRMQAELPLEGFDPTYFEYVPVWHDRCSLLAHTVQATHDQNFSILGDRTLVISVKKGDVFHCNNSYKFQRELFNRCAAEAGLGLVEKWFGDGNMDLSLFSVSSTSS